MTIYAVKLSFLAEVVLSKALSIPALSTLTLVSKPEQGSALGEKATCLFTSTARVLYFYWLLYSVGSEGSTECSNK